MLKIIEGYFQCNEIIDVIIWQYFYKLDSYLVNLMQKFLVKWHVQLN